MIKKEKYLIVGMKKSGKSAAAFLLKNKKAVSGFDEDSSLRNDAEIVDLENQGFLLYSDLHNIHLTSSSIVVLSPGFPTCHKILVEAKKKQCQIISEIELGLRYMKNPCIGITGTNGKTTLVLLISYLLQKSEKKAIALGNIGTPLTSYLLSDPDEKEIVVLELSSFQLEHTSSRALDVGVILNIGDDHLDRHKNVENYAKAKCRIGQCLKRQKPLFATKEVFHSYSQYISHEHCIPIEETKYFNAIFNDKKDKELLLFALIVCSCFHMDSKKVIKDFEGFKKPSHRIEFVATIKGISFYNDSKATNPSATLHAVSSLQENIILIVGGEDKGLHFHLWNDGFRKKVKNIILIGKSIKKMQEELKGMQMVVKSSLEQAVFYAYASAGPKDKILLSPGCASFDMFKNYEDRGNSFKEIVSLLEKGGK